MNNHAFQEYGFVRLSQIIGDPKDDSWFRLSFPCPVQSGGKAARTTISPNRLTLDRELRPGTPRRSGLLSKTLPRKVDYKFPAGIRVFWVVLSKKQQIVLTINIFDKYTLILIIIFIVMPKKTQHMYPATQKELSALGQRLKDARLRRRFSMEAVGKRAGISRPTLYKIEQGDPSVTFGHYVQVLRVLGLLDDLALVAKEDSLGRRLQDESMSQRERAPRTKS